MTDPKAITSRIDELEERLAHQDRTIEDLNETITGQWKEIEALKRELARLTDQLRAFETAVESSGAPEPPPPHY